MAGGTTPVLQLGDSATLGYLPLGPVTSAASHICTQSVRPCDDQQDERDSR